MPEILALTCPVCGAPLKPGAEQFGFCGSYIVIKTDLPKLDRHTLNQAVIQEHIADFRRRVRTNTYDEEAHYGLGVAYYSLGLIDDAVEELTQAARLMPENPHIQAQLAVTLYDSWKAGNTAAEAQMHSRIQRALLLDHLQAEATVLKAEVMIENDQIAEAIHLYQGLPPVKRDRVKAHLTGALTTTAYQRLIRSEWDGARWCWQTLQTIDDEAAKKLAIAFLERNRELIPKKIHLSRQKSPQSTTSQQSVQSTGHRILFTALIAVGALVASLILFSILSSILSAISEGDEVTGIASVIVGIAALLVLASPVIAGAVYWNRTQARRDPLSSSRFGSGLENFSRDEVLLGYINTTQTLEVADGVVEKLHMRDRAEAFRQSLPSGRR